VEFGTIRRRHERAFDLAWSRLTGHRPFDLLHVQRLVARCEADDEALVALFHDAVEDGLVQPDELSAVVPTEVLDSVLLLSRSHPVDAVPPTYEAYLDRLIGSGNRLALTVKCLDLQDHLRPSGAAHFVERPEKRTRYLVALERVHQALVRLASGA
jgi:(p)ppGpp synthase/HD superfamily hydrolase